MKTPLNFGLIMWKSSTLLFIILSLLCLQPRSFATDTKPNEPGPWPSIQVNTYSGNLFYQRTDLFIPTRGEIQLDIYFSYNSLKHQHDKGYGNGWSFSFGMYYKTVGNDIVIFREDGHEDLFTWVGANYLPPTGVYDELTEYTSGQFLLKTKHGIKYFFDDNSHKQLTGIVDRNNNTITLSYTAGKPTTITDPSGRMLNLSWVGDHLSSLTDPNTSPNRVIAFTYDETGNLLQVTRPLGNTWSYAYDADNMMNSMTNPRSNTVNVSYDQNDAVAGLSCTPVSYNKTFVYDNCDNTTTVSHTVSGNPGLILYTFDLSGRVTNIQHPDGSSVYYSWDDQNNLLDFTNEMGNIAYFTYDPMGNTLSKVDFMGFMETFTYESSFNQVMSYINKNGAPVNYTYDGSGNRLTMLDCSNNSESYIYDSHGQLTSLTDRKGQITSYLYDTFGNVTKVTDAMSFFDIFTYDAVGNRLTHTDKRGFNTTFTYDLLNRRTNVLDAEGYTSSYSYDGNDNLTGETNQNSQTTNYSYDPLNRLQSKTDAIAGVTNYTYDDAGNLLTETTPNGCTTTYTYNSSNRKTTLTDALNYSENYSYDPVGNLISSSDKNGNTTSYEYDFNGRVTKITWPDSFFDIYTYDPMGNRTNHTNKNGATTILTYDCLDRVILKSYPLGITESYVYDQVGHVLTYGNKNGIPTNYTYNAVGRIVTKADPMPGSESYTYDAAGNILTQTDKNGNTISYSYDDISRKISTQYPMGLSETYTYDGVGNRLAFTDKRSNTTTYSYDPLNRLLTTTTSLGITESYTYDAVGNQITFTDKNGNTTTFLYDCLDQNIKITDPLGYFESFTYDAGGHLTQQIDKNGGITTWNYNCCQLASKSDPAVFTEFYGYDPVGNRTSLTDKNGNITTYNYDALNRLTQITSPLVNQTILTYDGEGNTLSRRDANLNMVNYTYNLRNELTGIQYPDGASKTYTYDNNGNMLTASYTGGIGDNTNYSYDALDRLVAKTTNFGIFSKTMTYGYDENGNNTLIASETGNIQHVYDADDRLVQTTDQSGLQTYFENDNNGNQTAVNYPNGVSTYTTYDAMNRVLSVSTNDIPPPPASKPGSFKIKDAGGKILSPLFVTDYAVTNILEPNSEPGLGENEPVTIEITNSGMTMAMEVMASFSVNGVAFTPEFIPMPIPPEGGIGIYTFMQTADLSEPDQDYLIEACVIVMGDENPLNDCMTKVVVNEGGGGLSGLYQSFLYGYDPVGNKLWEEYLAETHTNYTYNTRNELTEQTTLPSMELVQYTYTPTGQRESKTVNGIVSLYEYNEDDILIFAGNVTYTPDNNGNRLSMLTSDGDLTTYLYGFDDELKQVNKPDGQSVQYIYSATGMMINRTVDGIPTYYLNAGLELYNEYNAAGTATVVHNPGISITQGSQVGYYFLNGYGSTTMQMGPDKTVMATATFDPFGIMTSSSGSWINNEVMFAFSLRDEISDLYHRVKGWFVDLFTSTPTNPQKEETSKPAVSIPETKKVTKEKDPKTETEKKKQKCCGVKKFVVKWSKPSGWYLGQMLRIDVNIEFKSDDAHDPACCEFCQNVKTVVKVISGPDKGWSVDTSPMHDDHYSRADDLDRKPALNDPGFYTNDNPGITNLSPNSNIDYSFTAEQMVKEKCESPCPKGTVIAKRGPHTATVKGKEPRTYTGVPVTLDK